MSEHQPGSREALRDALEWIRDACGEPPRDPCPHCLRPTGVAALRAHAEAALASPPLASSPEQEQGDTLEPFLAEIRSHHADKPCEVHAAPQVTCMFCLWHGMTRARAALQQMERERDALKAAHEG